MQLAGDNVLQEALWHLRQADLTEASLDVDVPVSQRQAKRDYRAIASSLRTSLEVLWQSATIEGSGVFADFASFVRLSLADTAEMLSERAAEAAQGIRSVEDEVQSGDRNIVGLKRKSSEEANEDPHIKFEKGMDTAKEIGSSAIETGEQAAAKANELAEKSSNRLSEAGRQVRRAHSLAFSTI
jgi:hypothetical protein